LRIRIQEEESNCGGDEVLVLSGGGTVRIDERGQKRSTRLGGLMIDWPATMGLDRKREP